MRLIPTQIILSILVVPSFVGSTWAGAFEGIVHFKDTRNGSKGEQTAEFDYFTKANKIRIEMQRRDGQHAAAILMDPDARKTTILMAAQRMYMEFPIKEATESAPELSQAAGKGPTIVKTGKTDTVLGYSCELVTIKTGHGESDICASKDLGQFYSQRTAQPSMGRHGASGGGEADYAWAKEFRDKGYFPLRAVTKDESGTEINRLEATKIEKKPLDASLFSVPEGYTKFDLAGMIGGKGMPSLPPGLFGGKGMPPGMPPAGESGK